MKLFKNYENFKFWPYNLNQDGGVYYNMQIFSISLVTQTYDVLTFILYFSWN